MRTSYNTILFGCTKFTNGLKWFESQIENHTKIANSEKNNYPKRQVWFLRDLKGEKVK